MKQNEVRRVEQLFKQLESAERTRFPKTRQRMSAPNEQGVYVIYSPGGRVLHVGSTPRAKKGIAQRLKDHLATQSSFTLKHLDAEGSKLRKGYQFSYLIVPDARRRALLEALAIGRLCPAHIGLGKSVLAKIAK